MLPKKDVYKTYKNGCEEKLNSYCSLAFAGFPVLKSVVVPEEELSGFGKEAEDQAKAYLGSSHCMIRYLYRKPCHNVRNGGKILSITSEKLMAEHEQDADLWLLEPSRREENVYCCNICLNREMGRLHIEILGKGFDISDINKGKICPHEWIDLPYPIEYGANGDWWKWAQIHICSQKEYMESIKLRKERLHRFQMGGEMVFDAVFCPMDLSFLERIIFWIQQVEQNGLCKRAGYYNLSCSFETGGRLIFWDIQTPEGKYKAYS